MPRRAENRAHQLTIRVPKRLREALDRGLLVAGARNHDGNQGIASPSAPRRHRVLAARRHPRGSGDARVALARRGPRRRVSVSSTAGEADAACTGPAISQDGRIVSFLSTATNLVDGAPAAASRWTSVERLDPWRSHRSPRRSADRARSPRSSTARAYGRVTAAPGSPIAVAAGALASLDRRLPGALRRWAGDHDVGLARLCSISVC